MKKIILLTTLFVQLGLIGQEYFPIPFDSTSVWRVERWYNDETCVYHYNSLYYINGTTTIGGKEYYKVYESGHYWTTSVNPMNPCSGSSYDYNGVFKGGIRSEDGKTYGYSDYFPTGLMMDFTLNVGDTLTSELCYEWIVDSIDSVMVNNDYRKRIHLSSWYEYVWMLEGVGNSKGLFERFESFENDSWFKCYGENGETVYGSGNCDYTVGYHEQYQEEELFIIYPNPTSGIVAVEISNPEYEISSYRLTNIYGKEIEINNITKKQNNKIVLDLINYKSGIYLLQLNVENQEPIIKKIIKK